MPRYQVHLASFPKRRLQDFYRIWLKHDHRRTDEEILAALHAFDPQSPPIVADYPVEEAAERVVAELENLGGKARMAEVATTEAGDQG